MNDQVTEPENAGEMQDGKFKPGQSGNPAGKPKGTLNKTTQAVMVLLEGEAQALTRKAIDLAKEGDIAALRLCLERLAPAPKSSAQCINVDLPDTENLTEIAQAILDAAAKGEIPPDIASQLITAVAGVAKVNEMENMHKRLEALEKAIKGDKK